MEILEEGLKPGGWTLGDSRGKGDVSQRGEDIQGPHINLQGRGGKEYCLLTP